MSALLAPLSAHGPRMLRQFSLASLIGQNLQSLRSQPRKVHSFEDANDHATSCPPCPPHHLKWAHNKFADKIR